MHASIQKLIHIKELVKSKEEGLNKPKTSKIIAISKTFSLDKIMPLINYGHNDYGENKVQEALDKWTTIKEEKPNLKLHLVGKLQTNKVKFAIKIFDFIHSVDSKKLAKKISEEQSKQNKNVKIFLQVNIGNEEQKSGILKNDLYDLYHYCNDLKLDIVGLMCIPPLNSDPNPFFQELNDMNKNLGLKELSMGMSSDYIKAVENDSTYLRIGSAIFGERS
jgi:pyridoxal phosphate enzyme (YggS family)